MTKKAAIIILGSIVILFYAFLNALPSPADVGTFGSLGEEQAAEKSEIEKMKSEMGDIKASTNEAIQALNQLNTQAVKQNAKEIHLFCKESSWQISPTVKVNCLTYNGLLPGPTIRVPAGQLVRVVLHNQMKRATSLHFHGMVLPQAIDGLPKQDNTLVKPGETYAYQFIAQPEGTYWYHPQIIHGDQKTKGLYGALIVEPNETPSGRSYDQDTVIILSDLRAPALATRRTNSSIGDSPKAVNALATSQSTKPTETTTMFLMNGHTAPDIPALAVSSGSRVRLRIINAGQTAVPLHLSGHRFQVVSINGDSVTNQVTRDTITLGVSDRVDLEFVANNPGVWSLGSELLEQTTVDGKFPGGIACVVRYTDKRSNPD